LYSYIGIDTSIKTREKVDSTEPVKNLQRKREQDISPAEGTIAGGSRQRSSATGAGETPLRKHGTSLDEEARYGKEQG